MLVGMLVRVRVFGMRIVTVLGSVDLYAGVKLFGVGIDVVGIGVVVVVVVIERSVFLFNFL